MRRPQSEVRVGNDARRWYGLLIASLAFTSRARCPAASRVGRRFSPIATNQRYAYGRHGSAPLRQVICPSGKSAVAHENLSIPSRKNISLVPSGKSPPLVLAVSHPKEGRTRNRHGRWVRDAMDALVSQGERYKRGRQSRVFLAPRRWCQVCG